MPFVLDLLNTAVERIQLDTAWGPPVVLDEPFAPGEPNAPPSLFERVMKPALRIYARGGGEPITVAPAGDPGASKWPLVSIGLGFVGAMILWRILQPKRR